MGLVSHKYTQVGAHKYTQVGAVLLLLHKQILICNP